MLNATANPENAKFLTFLNGTSSMYTTLLAPVLASKGHYYQLAEGMENITATIVDKNDKPIVPTPENDDTFLGVE